jgi:hypothetical protein
VDLHSEIEKVFGGKAFARPLFYAYGGGLRFALSEGGGTIDQFLLAIRKAHEICSDIFDAPSMVACLRVRSEGSAFGHREVLRELSSAGITIPRAKSVWVETVPPGDQFDPLIEEWVVSVAFDAPATSLQSLLWCAFAGDFGSIRPRPMCDVYLFELAKGVMVLPYDDRGMDVVGPNHVLLRDLYRRHHRYLLEYDRASVERTFGLPPYSSPNER